MPIIALNNLEHKQLRVRSPSSFDFLANVHMLPVVIQECGHAGNEFPVVFVKKDEPQQFQLVAVFGLSGGENLFVRDSQWHGLYMPAIIQNGPFKLITDGENTKKMILGVDTDNELVAESGGEGEALFDEAGDDTDYLKNQKESIVRYFEHDRITYTAIKALTDLDLITACNLTVAAGDQEINVDGVYTIDEEKLQALPDEEFNELRKSGLLPLIYAQMLSINQFHRLAKLKASLNNYDAVD